MLWFRRIIEDLIETPSPKGFPISGSMERTVAYNSFLGCGNIEQSPIKGQARPNGLGLVDVPIVSIENFSGREAGVMEEKPNKNNRATHLGSRTIDLRADIDRLNWWTCAAKKKKKSRKRPKGNRSKSSGRLGASACGFQRVLPSSFEISILNPSFQDANRAKAISTLEVGEKMGVTFDIPINSIVERFQELVESEAWL
ncbi:hypothetical protein V6N11_024147 [Hibiscus sabdariffa]|uniref:Uncharacterized protein n=1 Tax=Hibiscus sabdariffa TaxID=183260 RepID=A0ABR2ADE0_9ROSI